ncbi:pyrimidine (deoxy)nucleoside triphosphate pyrophosphohydrolase [Streptomyces sp. YIM 130001]|uniref:NUDIX hydrolase n=1 Tax=Streptomyces sp. YIM 130001 TaxID=2259644 RepID=UPI000E65561E|nr:NUDIX domain-containing protein [Streptomyces sp. YIM 130001]RII15901.1 pyrimidine (deoxy)nucleoside triphosphate pyrophosphohydrolase [Streptomyces sp. YIM 130001]
MREATLIDTVAWVRIEGGRILCARSRGKDVFYIPGGKREHGESDLQTLIREVEEELSVAVVESSASPLGVYEAQAHGEADGVLVRMSCYAADYRGTLEAAAEIEETAWFGYADRPAVAPVDQLLFDDLKARGELI